MNALIYTSGSSALCKHVKQVGLTIDRALELHCFFANHLFTSAEPPCKVSRLFSFLQRGEVWSGREIGGLSGWGPVQHQLSSVPRCRQELLQHV